MDVTVELYYFIQSVEYRLLLCAYCKPLRVACNFLSTVVFASNNYSCSLMVFSHQGGSVLHALLDCYCMPPVFASAEPTRTRERRSRLFAGDACSHPCLFQKTPHPLSPQNTYPINSSLPVSCFIPRPQAASNKRFSLTPKLAPKASRINSPGDFEV